MAFSGKKWDHGLTTSELNGWADHLPGGGLLLAVATAIT